MKPIILLFKASLLVPVSSVIFVAGPFDRDVLRFRHTFEHGVSGTAAILPVSDSGTVYNHQVVASVKLIVTPALGGSYEAETHPPVNGLHSPFFQPGRRVSVKIDPDHPE